MDHQKITKSELALGLTMSLFYLCTLYALVTGQRTLLLFFFLLHSCLCIVFFLVSCGQISLAVLDHCENNRREEELEDEISRYQESLTASEKKEKDLLRENQMLTSRVAELETAAAMIPSAVATQDAPNPLLPPEESIQEFDLAALAGNVLNDFHQQSSEHGIRLQLSTSGEPVMMTADPALLTVIIRNITDNAIKYAGRGNSLFLTLSSMGDQIFLVFKDNGPGLPEEEAGHIFDLNYQGSNRRNGSGLGLTQVKAVIEHLGGTIEVKSGDCPGMALYITLPANAESGNEEESV